MEHVIKELHAIKRAIARRTDSLEKSKIERTPVCSVLFSVIDDALSKIHCKYSLDLAHSLITGTPSDTMLHQKLEQTIQLLSKTKESVNLYITNTKTDPIPNTYLLQVLQDLQYTIVDTSSK